MEFRILGPLEVVADGRDLTPVRPKQRALLALLLLRANEVVSNDELLEALWGEAPPHTAHTALHGHVSSLRKLLGSDAIQTKPPGYVLQLRPDQLDLRRSRMMTGENEQAIRIGDETLTICDQFGLDEIRASVLVSMGPSWAGIGDLERSIADEERGIAVAQAINSPEAVRGYGNLASILMAVGDLPGCYLAVREGLQLAERLGLRWYIRWLHFDSLQEPYYTGRDWDGLVTVVEEVAGERAILKTVAYQFGIRVRLARGDLPGALAYTDRMLDVAGDSREPQIVGMAWEVAAFAKLAAGEREVCENLVERLLELPDWDSLWAYPHAPLLGIVLHALGRGDELARVTARARTRTPWLEVSLASAADDFAQAAEIYEQIGDRPDEAYARLKAGEQLVAQGRRPEANDQLERALTFFRLVGATAYIREAKAMLSV